ncbi:MAG: transporter substrate-binding domain-containing protein [Spirochaetaceae bacterium]|nr:transporter substrate-binding domain-containing protein [Spirochaetaceae bacterium]
MKKLLITLLLLLSISTLALFASGSKESKSDNGKETITMATNAEWPPLEFVDDKGKVVGYEVELTEALSTVTNYNWKVVNVAWDGIFAGMANGAYDGLASGVSVTEERKQAMIFSNPILTEAQAIIVNSGTTNPPTNLDELVGKKVGVLMGSIGDLYLQDSGKDINIKQYDNIAFSIEDMLNNNLDAVVVDSIIAGEFVLKNENYKAKLIKSGEADSVGTPIAMCFPKGDTEIVEIVNKALAELEANGTIATLKAKYGIL